MRRLRLGDSGKTLRVRDEPEPPPTHKGAKLPLVCVHGAGMSSVVYMDLIRRLSPLRRVIAPDLPGHGQSDRWHDDITLRGYADAVGTTCAMLGVGKAVLCGHSMGGAVALTCALAFPDRVAGLLLLNTAARLPVAAELYALLERELPGQRDKNGRVERMPDGLAELSFSPETPLDLKQRWQAMLMSATPEVIVKDFAACASFDVRDALGKLAVPTLVIGGADDLLVPPARSQELARLIPGASFTLVDRSGHLSHIEQSEPTYAVIETFLRGLP